MTKKILALFIAVLILAMPLTQLMAADTPTQANIREALTAFKSRTSSIRGTLPEFVSIMEGLDGKGALGEAFEEIEEIEGNITLHERFGSIGIQDIRDALDIFRSEDGYAEVKQYVQNMDDGTIETNFIEWLDGTFNSIAKQDPDAPLKDLDTRITEKFGSWKEFLRHIKALNERDTGVFTEYLQFTYNSTDKALAVSQKTGLLAALNSYINDIPGTPVAEFNEGEINTLISASNIFLGKLAGTGDALTVAKALESLGYSVTGIPTSSGGGGGGGVVATPEEPTVEVPKDPEQPVTVSVPADSAEVEVTDGKAVVTFDDSTVKDMVQLISDAEKQAEEGRPLALVINLADSDKITDNAEVNLPAEVISAAFEKNAAVTVILKDITIDIPANAITFEESGAVKINTAVIEPQKALEDIACLENMETVGQVQEISITASGEAVEFAGSIALRFNLKGITANIDKLGVYYVNEKENRLEFVTGKVDRASAQLTAVLPHLSKYVLMEYDKTFLGLEKHWAKNYIESMAAKHVLEGKSETDFAPQDPMTRAEFAKIVVKAMELDTTKYQGIFEDVSADAWYADYVQTAFNMGLITGRGEGVFDPNGPIKRQEMMTIIGRALSEETMAKKDADHILYPFTDKALAPYTDKDEVADYARKHVALLIEKTLVSGYPDMTLKPAAEISRAEAAKIIYGFYNY